MLKTLIIADDSTGANASAILLKKINLKTLSLIDYKNIETPKEYDVIAISTDSRAVNEKDAYSRVKMVLNQVEHCEPLVINKRIDSTLRGNIGAELNAFKEQFPHKKIAIIPTFPSSKRVCRNGIIYVNDVILEQTDVAKDPKMPINISSAKEIIMKQFKGTIANIYLDIVRTQHNLAAIIKENYQKYDAIIFDSETNNDIELICKALIDTNIDIICVDPGPFTYFYTIAKMRSHQLELKKYIYLIGSVTNITFEQLKVAIANEDFAYIYLNSLELIEDKFNDKIPDLIKLVKEAKQKVIILTTTDIYNRVILNLHSIGEEKKISTDEVSKLINYQLALILHEILLQVKNIGAVFSSGGDTTLGFLKIINAKGIYLKKEVMPLCVYGLVVGGEFDKLPLITKGGMIGGKDAYIEIKNFLEEVESYD
jgi:uncharacterized protein YgbK (DUF1537 family)